MSPARRYRAATARHGPRGRCRPPHFVRSSHAAGGRAQRLCGALAPGRRPLGGADRRARRAPARPLCLVAVGTAMTIDLLDAKGRHRGGNIIPGPKLMVESLLENTAGIRRRAGGRKAANNAVARAGRHCLRMTPAAPSRAGP